jgi:hypothetical protein
MDRIEEWLERCGDWSWMAGEDKHAIFRQQFTFESFVKRLIRDALRYDQATAEIVMNRMGQPLCWLPVDGSTIRINKDASGFVQVIDGRVMAEFSREELLFGIRRPRTDIESLGYGTPELLELAEIVTAYLWGFQFNMNYFRQGFNSKGFLVVNGAMNPEQLMSFRRDWAAMVTGVQAAHRVPILNPVGKESSVTWVNVSRTNQDMEYKDWMNWLLKLICALFLMDPAEIGFQFGNEGQQGQTFQSGIENRIQTGRDKGLRPLIRSTALWINRSLIWPERPEFELTFEGLSDIREQERVQLDKEKLASYMTVDEVRAEHDLPPLPYGIGKIVPNPSLNQWTQTLAMNGVLPLDEFALSADKIADGMSGRLHAQKMLSAAERAGMPSATGLLRGHEMGASLSTERLVSAADAAGMPSAVGRWRTDELAARLRAAEMQAQAAIAGLKSALWAIEALPAPPVIPAATEGA